jgi:hypothetical protein
MLFYRQIICVAALLALFSAEVVEAQQPTSLELTLNGSIPGQPDGPVAVRLRLYDASTDGTLLFEETQTLNVASERFTARIGAATAGGVPTAVFQSAGSAWIAFALDATPDVEIGDRTAVTSSGYAHLALTAVGALTGVAHDGTLNGDGSVGAPLQVAAPLQLTSQVGIASATIRGFNTNGGSYPGYGVWGSGSQGIGVYGTTSGAGDTAGVYGQAFGTNARGVWGEANSGVNASGVYGHSTSGNGVHGVSESGAGVLGDTGSPNTAGVYGRSSAPGGTGVFGAALNGSGTAGVVGSSSDGTGVFGSSTNGTGVFGSSSSGHAGYFAGRVRVTSIPAGPSTGQVCFNPAGDLLQCTSSLRWKTNVQPFHGGLDIVQKLRPISFTWKEVGTNDIGLGAEDVAQVAPSLAITSSDGEVQGVKYDRLNVVLINAIQQQQGELKTLQEANSALNARLEAVEKLLATKSKAERRDP